MNRLVVYRTPFARRNQRWRWYLIASNGRKVASSGEGYSDRDHARVMGLGVIGGSYKDATVEG